MTMIFEKTSSYDLETTIERLKSYLSEVGFGVLWSLNFKDKLAEKGFPIEKDFWIFEACNPAKAQKVFSENPQVGYFLPCKVAVYDTDKGVKVGMPAPTALIGSLPGGETLQSLAAEVEDALKGVIERTV